MGETSLGNLGEAKVQIRVDWDALNGELEKAKGSFSSAFAQTGKIMRNVGAAMTAGLTVPIAGLIGKSVMAATRVTELASVNELLGKSAGYSEEFVKEQAASVQDMGIEAAASQGIIADFIKAELDLADASKIARVAQDAAVIAGKNSTETTQILTQAIITGRTELFKSAGMIIDLNGAYEDYASVLGRSAESLTEQEKVQARVNATLEYGERIAGAYLTAMEDPGKVLRSYPRYLNDIAVAFGQSFLPAFKDAIFIGKDMLGTIKDLVSEGGALEPVINDWGQAFEGAAVVMENMVQKFKDMDPATLQLITNLIGIGAVMGPMLLVGGQMIVWGSKAYSAIISLQTAFGAAQMGTLAFTGTLGILVSMLAAVVAGYAAQGKARLKAIADQQDLGDEVAKTSETYEEYLAGIDEANEKVDKLAGVTGGYGKHLAENGMLVEALTEDEWNLVKANEAVEESTDGVSGSMQELGKLSKENIDWTNTDEVIAYYQQLDAAREKIRSFKEEFAVVTSEAYFVDTLRQSSEYYNTILDLAGSYTDSLEEIEEKQTRLNELTAISETGGYLDGVWVSASKAKEEIALLTGEIGELRAEMSLMANQVVYDMAMAELAVGGIATAEYEQLMELGVQLGLFSREAADTAIAEFDRALKYWTDIKFDDKDVSVHVGFTGASSAFVGGTNINVNPNAQQKAAGGLVYDSRMEVVGERGPELYVPNYSGSIIANSEIMRGLGGGSRRDDSMTADLIAALNRMPDEKSLTRMLRDAVAMAVG